MKVLILPVVGLCFGCFVWGMYYAGSKEPKIIHTDTGTVHTINADFFYVKDINGGQWNIRRGAVQSITPDSTDTNTTRINLNSGMTVCIWTSNRAMVVDSLLGIK